MPLHLSDDATPNLQGRITQIPDDEIPSLEMLENKWRGLLIIIFGRTQLEMDPALRA
jgi:hypothetical protein